MPRKMGGRKRAMFRFGVTIARRKRSRQPQIEETPESCTFLQREIGNNDRAQFGERRRRLRSAEPPSVGQEWRREIHKILIQVRQIGHEG